MFYLGRVCMEYTNFQDWRDGRIDLDIASPPEIEGFYTYAALHWYEYISRPDELSGAMRQCTDSLISPELGTTKAWLHVRQWDWASESPRGERTPLRYEFEEEECSPLFIANVALCSQGRDL